jgi:hypothetical protein
MRRSTTRALVAGLFAAVAACGAGTSSEAADLAQVEACNLLTNAEVEKLIGGPAVSDDENIAGWDTVCYWKLANGNDTIGSPSASLEIGDLGELASEELASLKSAVGDTTDIEGVGDEAFSGQYSMEGTSLLFRDGGTVLWLSTSRPGLEDYLIEVTNAVLERLP